MRKVNLVLFMVIKVDCQSETYQHKIKKADSFEQFNNIPVMNHHATSGIRKVDCLWLRIDGIRYAHTIYLN